MKKIFIKFGLIATLGVPGIANAAYFADKVTNFVGGNGVGAGDQNAGKYRGNSGTSVYDPLSATTLADVIFALGRGGDNVTPGSIIISFRSGGVLAGPSADLRVYDSFGRSEGGYFSVTADASKRDNVSRFAGNADDECFPMAPCAKDVDIADMVNNTIKVNAISTFQIDTAQLSVIGFPEAYDFDGVEVLNFRAVPAAIGSIPEPGTLGLIGIALVGIRYRVLKKVLAGSTGNQIGIAHTY